jgi:hypothetical protein
MGIKVKGNMIVGEIVNKTVSPVDIKQHIRDKIKNPNTVGEIVNKTVSPVDIKHHIREKMKKIHEEKPLPLTRQIPVKTYNIISENDYQSVKEGELVKHYNKRSSYLVDMIDNTEIE